MREPPLLFSKPFYLKYSFHTQIFHTRSTALDALDFFEGVVCLEPYISILIK